MVDLTHFAKLARLLELERQAERARLAQDKQQLPLAELEARGLVVNVGSDEEVSIGDLADLVIEESGSRVGKRFVPLREAYGEGFADFSRRRPDLARLRELTGFRPRRTLREAVRDVLAAVPTA